MSTAVAQFEHLMRQMMWLDSLSTGLDLPADERSLIALGCFDVAIEHQAAIALLCSSELYGSAFALLRVLVESLIRGMWLRRCATDQQIRKFKTGDIDRSFKQLVADIEPKLGRSEVLSSLKTHVWKTMSGFTHTGFHQVSRRHNSGKVEANYSEQDIVFILVTTELFGAVAHGEVIDMSGRQDLILEYNAKVSLFTGPAKGVDN
ncbi:DUF6988 family protein [Herbaspirillum rubrisubalbicans]|uniref:Uncharacterized protein n=1 Tax=Herbaspirillum rubrisubalbicans TaxID=80842 RepID=A0AAD0UAK7_9BURK|nr:hypothetical protein [Herbaspirillum rubrisubalbicans]AYR25346.1 hypothetical protein RC54_16630 [Herbaspirillum rubrisubalbicans]